MKIESAILIFFFEQFRIFIELQFCKKKKSQVEIKSLEYPL